MEVAAIIAVHNRLAYTKRCLKSLERASSKHNVNLVIIDDGSSDGTLEWIKTNYSQATILHGDGNLWFGGATQLGINYVFTLETKCDYVLIINNDTFLHEGSLDSMLEASSDKRKVISVLYCQEDNGDISTAGYIWEQMRGLVGICHTSQWEKVSKNVDFVPVDSVATTATLFPTHFLVASSKIPLKRHPHHRYDVLLSASCRQSGAQFLTSTKVLATHIYGKSSNVSNWRQQTLSEFWRNTFQDPLQVAYLPGLLEATYAASPSFLSALPVIAKIITSFLVKILLVTLNTLARSLLNHSRCCLKGDRRSNVA